MRKEIQEVRGLINKEYQIIDIPEERSREKIKYIVQETNKIRKGSKS